MDGYEFTTTRRSELIHSRQLLSGEVLRSMQFQSSVRMDRIHEVTLRLRDCDP